ncbi:MAG TPA: hypothetical protein VHO68_09185, partial [Bacteroidales bacterium]|nr:hypothetical protein [Bacteroidales bacterium]
MGEFKTTVPQIGILEWFRLNDYDQVEKVSCQLKALGIKELRTGISWADYLTPEGEKWYDWLIPFLSRSFNILPCFLYTPPSLGIKPERSSPPRNPGDYADFIELVLKRNGKHFKYVELWNEPNNWNAYDYTLDESWGIFASMIILAATRVHETGRKVVLGGISPIDPGWVKLMGERKVLETIDIIGIHGYPDVFDSHWRSWEESIDVIQNALNTYNSRAEIWITQTGYSTWRYDERKQVEKFIKVLNTPVKRVYWYSLKDTHFSSGNYFDEREYHFGMMQEDGSPKLLYKLWSSGGIKNVIKNQWMTSYKFSEQEGNREPVLITGGAGFIGTNL